MRFTCLSPGSNGGLYLFQKFRFIAMDTEFPGVVARPIGEFRSTSDYQYQLLRCNVDLLKIIQLGITFMDDQGKTPPVFCYQFNFKFNLTEDMYAQDSIDLLQVIAIGIIHVFLIYAAFLRTFGDTLGWGTQS